MGNRPNGKVFCIILFDHLTQCRDVFGICTKGNPLLDSCSTPLNSTSGWLSANLSIFSVNIPTGSAVNFLFCLQHEDDKYSGSPESTDHRIEIIYIQRCSYELKLLWHASLSFGEHGGCSQ